MRNAKICVAAYDLETGRLVRPLQPNGQHWLGRLYGPDKLFPGNIALVATCSAQGASDYPHRTEDLRVEARLWSIQRLSNEDFYSYVMRRADASVEGIFGRRLEQNAFLEEKVRCRSLGGILVAAQRIRLYRGFRERLRCSFVDAAGAVYDFPVTAMDFLGHFGAGSATGFSAMEANELIQSYNASQPIMIRIGLARAYGGGEHAWNPKRCYAQINGFIFPEDHWKIFSGPPAFH